MKTATFTGSTSRFQHKSSIVAGVLLTITLSGCQTKPEAAALHPVETDLILTTEYEVVLDEASPREVPADSLRAVGAVDSAAMVAEHNRWRAQVGSPPLRWSDKLAGIAQDWADHLTSNGCAMYHSNNGYGENIYQASALMWSDGRRDFQHKTPKDVTDSWGSEIKYYNYADNSCSGVCGHYTQLVWKDTKEMGCAMSVCGDNSQIWVCSYYPPGNFVGQKPY